MKYPLLAMFTPVDMFACLHRFLSLLRTTFAEERESKNETDAAALEVKDSGGHCKP